MNSYSLLKKPKFAIRAQGLLYALPVLATTFLGNAIAVLQGIYAKDFGLALTSIAMVLLVSRVFDAVTDPLIGFCSDWYRARGGSRKPFIVVGSVLFIISAYFLYIPPDDVSVRYFLVWYLAFYFSLTLFEIPHMAWANDLSISSQDNTRFYSWRTLMASIGLMAFFVLPLLPVFETTAITPETLRWSVFVAGCLLTVLVVICVRKLPASNSPIISSSSGDASEARLKKESVTQIWLSIRHNPSLLLFLLAFVCWGFGVGMSIALLFLFIDSYLGLGAVFAGLYVISHVFSISSVGLWAVLANRWGKHAVWGIAMALLGIGMFGLGFMSPDHVSPFFLLLCLTPLYCGYAAGSVIAPSLLADIIDYTTWKFERDRAGTYFALYGLIGKTNIAIGGALGMALAGWYGFDATATVHSYDSALGLRIGVAWLPLPFLLFSFFFIQRMPITARRHAIVRRGLDRRKASRDTAQVIAAHSLAPANAPSSS